LKPTHNKRACGNAGENGASEVRGHGSSTTEKRHSARQSCAPRAESADLTTRVLDAHQAREATDGSIPWHWPHLDRFAESKGILEIKCPYSLYVIDLLLCCAPLASCSSASMSSLMSIVLPCFQAVNISQTRIDGC
jgi:hypothetical protein